ncbi:MAG TPA: UvrD-helicase domain-containing protein [Bacteroidota bacterium]|nr:UvrD-helicase domain-containing protein [Bacteroidota bacterium]
MNRMLTDHQKRALQHERHLSVTANAGAGKTTVLVQRFIEILIRTREPVSRLVAITFTENAAGELRKRIADLIELKLEQGNEEETQLLERARDELSSANIGTIHSFCAHLLREYPVEADVDASFTVIEGVDRELLLQESLRETLQALLSEHADAGDREGLLTVLRLLGRRKVFRYLEHWLKKRELIDRMTEPDGCMADHLSDADILNMRQRMVQEELAQSAGQPEWREALGRLVKQGSGKKAGELSALLSSWGSLTSQEEKIRWYQELCPIVFTSSGSLRRDWTGPQAAAWDEGEDAAILHAHWRSSDGVRSTFDPGAEQLMLRLVRILLNLYRKTLDSYDSRKSEFGQLDFDDLQIKTRELLRREHIRKELAERFRFIMIDEYQDTDQLQYEILRLLISDFRSGNLFIVGDPKQSIFRFRNAEVRVFEETKKAIAAASGAGLENDVSLAESFRLLTGPADFVNRVFSGIMGGARPSPEIRHEELIKGRSNNAEGKVEMLLVEEGVSDQVTDGIAIECRMIAQRVTKMVERKEIVYEGARETPRPIKFNDVAILLRGRTHLRALEIALAEHGIPYVLSAGIGFYQTQEILDFLSLFKFLLNPEDDVALVALLRSPFFAIPDSLLFEVSRETREETFWGKMNRYAAHHRDAMLVRAASILREDLELANRLSIPSLVERILLQTGWHGTVSGLPFGGQNVANIDKLLRIARDFEARGFNSLFDFAERLKTLADHERHEGQAPPEIAQNCVQILTIHGAKGLEFPVVFIPFLDQKFQYDASPFLDSRMGIAFKSPDPSDPAQERSTPFFELLRRDSIRKTEAEEKRILYVACTRSRDVLVLSGQLNGKISQPSYLGWILDGLRLDPRSIRQGDTVLPEAPLKVMEWSNGSGKVREKPHALALSIALEGRLPGIRPFIADRGEANFRLPELWIEPVEGTVLGEVFSASQIKTYLECPTKYYLRYRLGLPETRALPSLHEESDDESEGELEGSLTHLILRDIQSNVITTGEVEERARRLVFNTPMLAPEERERANAAVVRNVTSFLHSGFGREVLSAAETKTEFTVNSVLGEDFVTGTIDRLYRDASGIWHILDYKTDGITREDVSPRSELYRPQLAVYAWLIQRAYRQESVRASLLFLQHPSSPVHFIFGPAETRRDELIFRDVIGRVKSGQFDRKIQICRTCTYRSGDDCLLRPG